MQGNIDPVALGAMFAFMVISGVIVGLVVILRSSFTSFHAAVIDLYKSLWNPIIDYSFRITVVLKNLYWLPLGVDHRIFKAKYKKVENVNGNAEIVDVENLFPIAPKSGYFLLCGTVWGISFYVWYAISHIVITIYGPKHDEFIGNLPYLLGAVVALIDTWILRHR